MSGITIPGGFFDVKLRPDNSNLFKYCPVVTYYRPAALSEMDQVAYALVAAYEQFLEHAGTGYRPSLVPIDAEIVFYYQPAIWPRPFLVKILKKALRDEDYLLAGRVTAEIRTFQGYGPAPRPLIWDKVSQLHYDAHPGRPRRVKPLKQQSR